jgi:glycosyltransferase involved in cell wall biosynthesis
MMRGENSVWQVPETCEWNRYIDDGANALQQLGWKILRPGLCDDGPAPMPTTAASTWDGPAPAIVHLHWPEKLAKSLGVSEAIALVRRFKQQGTRVVQTIHNVSPHEAAAANPWYQNTIDTFTDAVHFFSTEHEGIARANRPNLPTASVTIAHPRYASTPPVRVGCFGRLREYKRAADFAAALLAQCDLPVQLVVMGHADSDEIVQRLHVLAATDTRLDFRPRFATTREFETAIASVDWVAMPYRSLHSSGVLVTALQVGRRVLSPRPVGGTELYGDFHGDRWLVIDPWADNAAVAALAKAIEADRSDLSLPSWTTAAHQLASFYTSTMARPPRPYHGRTDQ